MRSLPYFCTIITLLFLQQAAIGQVDSVKNKTEFKLGIYYNSNLNYYGRTDSIKSNAVFPMGEIWFNDHFYINAAPVFVNNARESMEYAGTVATAGYQFNDQKRWSGNFYIAKPFYKSNSGLVQSALKAQVTSSITLRNKIINLTGGGDLKFSDKIDFGVTAGLDHAFRVELPAKFILVIDPSAYLNAGTQQFINTYYKKSNFLFFPGAEEAETETVKKFNILSYELSMPIIFAKDKFQLLLIPAYVIPKNLIAIEGRPDLSEHGKNLLYATIGAKITF